MQIRRTNWLLIPLILLAFLGSGMLPIATSGQSLERICANIHGDRLTAKQQKQWGLLVSKGRDFMSNCLTVNGGAEAEASALFDIGYGLTKQAKFDEAVPIFRRCATVKPDDTYCLTYLAEALDKEGEFGEELTVLNKCVTTKPDEAGCWVDLGIALDEVGKVTDARKAYQQAISIGGFSENNAAAIEFARVCLSHPQTATIFRGHRLGQSWQTFLRTEEGLCQIKTNTESCWEAALGKEAVLGQHGKDGSVYFSFEYGRFAHAMAYMRGGPAFAELTYFEKTYGKPALNFSHPEKGTAESFWRFSDGGEAHAAESKSKSGEFTIEFTIQASDSTLLPGALAANPHTPVFNGQMLGESWKKFAQTGSGLCRTSEDTAQACKDAAAGKDAILEQYSEDGSIKASFTFESGLLTQADLNTRMPKFVELDYLDKSYGQPYSETDNSADGYANRRWDYADGGQVSAMEESNSQGFLIMISAKTIPPQSTEGLDIDIITVGSKSRIVGLFQSGWLADADGGWEYLRFYSDGTVIECASIGTPTQINRWFQRPYDQSGKYEIQGSTIRFSISSSDNPNYTIDFRGQVQGNMLTLEWLSYQNGRQMHDSFHSVTPGD